VEGGGIVTVEGGCIVTVEGGVGGYYHGSGRVLL